MDLSYVEVARREHYHPIVENHTYEHLYFRNLIMYFFIGIALTECALGGAFFSFWFDIQGWYWDCVDNARTNLMLI